MSLIEKGKALTEEGIKEDIWGIVSCWGCNGEWPTKEESNHGDGCVVGFFEKELKEYEWSGEWPTKEGWYWFWDDKQKNIKPVQVAKGKQPFCVMPDGKLHEYKESLYPYAMFQPMVVPRLPRKL